MQQEQLIKPITLYIDKHDSDWPNLDTVIPVVVSYDLALLERLNKSYPDCPFAKGNEGPTILAGKYICIKIGLLPPENRRLLFLDYLNDRGEIQIMRAWLDPANQIKFDEVFTYFKANMNRMASDVILVPGFPPGVSPLTDL